MLPKIEFAKKALFKLKRTFQQQNYLGSLLKNKQNQSYCIENYKIRQMTEEETFHKRVQLLTNFNPQNRKRCYDLPTWTMEQAQRDFNKFIQSSETVSWNFIK